jgi:hypothetical protein
MRKYKFDFTASADYDSAVFAAGVKMREYFHDNSALEKVCSVGRKNLREMLGPDIAIPKVMLPPISYGHIICLGAKPEYPEDSEPNIKTPYTNIDEIIAVLKKDIDFSDNWLFKTYLEKFEFLKCKFPEEKVVFENFCYEAPITTAVLLRGQDFYMDLYDCPEKVKELLELVTQSIIRFAKLVRRINGQPEIDPSGDALGDDLAALVAPEMWEEFVLPYWNTYFEGLTTGNSRYVHVEGLYPQHLPCLKKCNLNMTFFDPSVSRRLKVTDVVREIDVPFLWLLSTFEIHGLDMDQIETWVDDALAAGATNLSARMNRFSLWENDISKFQHFVEVCRSKYQKV